MKMALKLLVAENLVGSHGASFYYDAFQFCISECFSLRAGSHGVSLTASHAIPQVSLMCAMPRRGS